MSKSNFSRGLAKAVAILCILAMLPVVYVSAAGLSYTATAGAVTLSDSEIGANGSPIDKNERIVVTGTVAAQGDWVTIVVAEKGSQGTGKIQYINELTAGVNGAFSFDFPLPVDIADGMYELRVAAKDTDSESGTSIVKKYFKIGGEAVPYISLPTEIPSVGIGTEIEFEVEANVSPLVAELIEVENPSGEDTVRTGTVTESGTGKYKVKIGTEGLAAGTYTIRVSNEQSGVASTVQVRVDAAVKYKVAMESNSSNGTAKVIDQEGNSVTEASFEAGELVSISASGTGFQNWSAFPDVAVFLDLNSSKTQFIMPEADIIVTANFKTATPTSRPGGGGGGGGGGGSRPTATPAPTAVPTPVATPTPGVDPTPTPTAGPSGEYPADIAGTWSEPYIKDVIDKGIMKGNTDGTFQPEGKLTRGEFATSMVRMLGLEPAPGKTFADTEGHWAQDYVSVLVENGVIQGYDDSTFGVEDAITREQIALILCRAYGLKSDTGGLDEFPDDSQISDWAREAVYTVQAFGYMTGDDAGFRPQDTATRGEIASVLSRMLESR